MGKIVFSMNITLDGYFEGPNHELDWSIVDGEMHDFYADQLNSADVILFGRVTYKMMKDYWPTAPSDPQVTSGMLNFANALNPMKKIVYSTTLKDPGWNTQVISKFTPDDAVRLKSEYTGKILLGSASIFLAFLRNGLVDEIQLMVHPVAIGKGTPLFSGLDGGIKLDYQWSKTLHSGAVVLCYQPAGMVLPPKR